MYHTLSYTYFKSLYVCFYNNRNYTQCNCSSPTPTVHLDLFVYPLSFHSSFSPVAFDLYNFLLIRLI